MEKKHISIISKELSIKDQQVINTISLFKEGATIPFISRYRKEFTGSLDEVQILRIRELMDQLTELDKRRSSIIEAIDKQGKLDENLRERINNANTITELEDIYLPYKQKRKTRATVAKEKGLEPLAQIIMKQNESDLYAQAESYISEEVETIEDALLGARDIIAEWISENENARKSIRLLFERNAIIFSKVIKGKEEEGEKYKDYFDSQEVLSKCASHRYLAMRRGEESGIMRVRIYPEEEDAINNLYRIFIKSENECANQIRESIHDSYKRLLGSSIENEFKSISKKKADEEAIKVFGDNLRQLLLAAPLGQKRVMGIDPGFRTGCKIVCIDEQGNLLHNETIFPHPPQNESKQAAKKINTLVNVYKIDSIAIGNGTASRETEWLIRKKVKFEKDVRVFVVSEDGASVYSASSIAREEFPEYDVTVRGAISIARRLMDPLAELVKIDPKSIGVGQYQHDVDQTKLKQRLDNIVESCVNMVGVNLNTASKHLLTYISGLGPQLANNIVEYRAKNGIFKSRKEINKVSRMGDKAFEQCAGFLRIPGAVNPLDNSAVHPESYSIVKKMARDINCSLTDLIGKEDLVKKLDINKYVTGNTGLPTLNDILSELAKPGRDPRNKIKVFEFSSEVRSIEDLSPGMVLPGIVTNITNFGAFVDVGVKQDGLVHISELKNEFVKNPADVVSLHQHVEVKVKEVDVNRKRIGLSMII
ncbi:Tex family protein [Bacteroidota bacterium]